MWFFREEIIKSWMNRAKKINSGSVDGLGGEFQFPDMLISCWISFDAFTCTKSEEDGSGNRNRDFWNEYQNMYTQEFEAMPTDFIKSLGRLKNKRIPDMRPKHMNNPDDEQEITDEKNLKQIIETIYQIRNNLFHGGKSIVDDKQIIQDASVVLFRLLETILIKEEILDW